ncbi:MAG: hypothetical protein MUC67_11650 [Acidobacteria bacterium]|jgi:hypothetical protein|nr:hypothetical protein [Acidobacteriota bacterium]
MRPRSRRRAALAAGIALVLLGCARGPSVELPPPPPGWRLAEGPTEYRPDTLWEYLDGGAPPYVAFGLQRLVHGRYERDGGSGGAVTLDLFAMGSELGAFGIYSRGRDPDDPPRVWGAEGYRTANAAAAWKGSRYVHAEADGAQPESIALMEALVAAACDAVPGPATPPALLQALPAEGRVARSERYAVGSLLGHAFLPGGVSATYRTSEGEITLFFSDLGSAPAAADALGKLRAHEGARGARVESVPSLGKGGFRCEDPGLGRLSATVSGRFVAGAFGDVPHEVLEPLIARLLPGLERLR